MILDVTLKQRQRQMTKIAGDEISIETLSSKPNQISWQFNHQQQGELGKIRYCLDDDDTGHFECTVSGHLDDPTTKARQAIFAPLARQILKTVFGTTAEPFKWLTTDDEPPSQIKIGSMVCPHCQSVTVWMILIQGEAMVANLENHARLVFGEIKKQSHPVWVISEPNPFNDSLGEYEAILAMPVWPERGQANWIKATELNQKMTELSQQHCDKTKKQQPTLTVVQSSLSATGVCANE